MTPIPVVVTGATGRMSREVLAALCRDPDLQAVGAISRRPTGPFLALPDGSGQIPYEADLASLLDRTQPQVLVDFTNAASAVETAQLALARGVALVIGTTGIAADQLPFLDQWAQAAGRGVVVAPNFALGAVVMIHLAKIAARYFESAEIIELHHDQKADAPSGTAIATAEAMRASRESAFHLAQTTKETLPGPRGSQLGGIALHSVRLPGLVAHQEVIFGAQGQTLTIRHDSHSRDSFMPGVVLAIRQVLQLRGLVYGLDRLLGLE